MKTVNKTFLVLISSFVAAASFAQANLGVRNTMSATKSVHAAATQGTLKASSNAASSATTQASAIAALNSKSPVNRSTPKTTKARVNSQASVHASDEAK